MATNEIGSLRVSLGMDSAQFLAGAAAAQSRLATLGSAFKGFAAGAIAALGVAKIAGVFTSLTEHMDGLGKAAQKIGIPVAELSKLEYAARLADVPLGDLQTAVSKLSRGLSEFQATGKGSAGDALQAIGVNALDAAGKLRPTGEIIADIAQKFSQYEDGANKTALAIALFGKSGADMIPLLNGGRDAIAGAGAELERFGGVVDEKAAKAAETFNDNMTRLKELLSGFGQAVLSPIVEVLADFTNGMIESYGGVNDLSKAISENLKTALVETAAAFLEITYNLKNFGTLARTVYDSIVNAGTDDASHFAQRWKNAYNEIDARGNATLATVKKLRGEYDTFSVVTGGGKGDFSLRKTAAPNANSVTLDNKAREIAAAKALRDAQLKADDLARQRARDEESRQRAIDEARRRSREEAKSVYEATRTPMEQYAARLDYLDGLQKRGLISQDTLNRAVGQAQEDYISAAASIETYNAQSADSFSLLDDAAETLRGTFEDMFSQALDGSFKLKDSLAALSQQLASKGFSRLLDLFFDNALGKGSGADDLYGNAPGGGLGDIFKNLLGFAKGGTIFPTGGGGVDSQVVAFRKSPNERVDISTPGQKLYNGGGGNVTIVDQRRNAPQVEQQSDGLGNLRLIIRDAVNRELPGALSRQLPAQFGALPLNKAR